MTTPIDALRPVVARHLVDRYTGRIVRTYKADEASARRATRAADRLDAEYGAVRYTVQPIFGA